MIMWIRWKLAFTKGLLKAFWRDLKYPNGLGAKELGYSSCVKAFLAWHKQWHIDNKEK